MRPLPKIPQAARNRLGSSWSRQEQRPEASPALPGTIIGYGSDSPVGPDASERCPFHVGHLECPGNREQHPFPLTYYSNLHRYLSQVQKDPSLQDWDLSYLIWDPIPDGVALNLVRSLDHRERLREAASVLGLDTSVEALQAEHQDLLAIRSTCQQLVMCKYCKRDCTVLQGEDSQKLLDLIQELLAEQRPTTSNGLSSMPAIDSDTFKQCLIRLSMRMSRSSGKLPSSMALDGVKLLQRDPVKWGAYSDVYQARRKGDFVALKRMRMYLSTRDKALKDFLHEALLWRYLVHKHVLPFYGVDRETFPESVALVSPWMTNGNVTEYLEHQEPSLDTINALIKEIILGLDYLHNGSSINVVHGDLRGPNVLIDADGHARLADFGLALLAVQTAFTESSVAPGTARYMAPELHQPERYGLTDARPTKASDIYSLGCLILELFTCRPPFSDLKQDTTVAVRVLEGIRPTRPAFDECRGLVLPDDLWNLIEACWTEERRRRPDITTIVSSADVSWQLPKSSRPGVRPLPVAAHRPFSTVTVSGEQAASLEAVLCPVVDSRSTPTPTPTPRPPPPPPTRSPPPSVRKSLDELRGQLIKVTLQDSHELSAATISVQGCTDGAQVLAMIVKKFVKMGYHELSRSNSDANRPPEESEHEGLTMHGWGIFLRDNRSTSSEHPLSASQLLAICHTDAYDPVRKRGLILRRVGNGNASKPSTVDRSENISGDSPQSGKSVSLLPKIPSMSVLLIGRKAGSRSVDHLSPSEKAGGTSDGRPGTSHQTVDTIFGRATAGAMESRHHLSGSDTFSPPMTGPSIRLRPPTLPVNTESVVDIGPSAPGQASRSHAAPGTPGADPSNSGYVAAEAGPQQSIPQDSQALNGSFNPPPNSNGYTRQDSLTPSKRGVPLYPLLIDATVFPQVPRSGTQPATTRPHPNAPSKIQRPSTTQSASPITPEPMRNARPTTEDVYAQLDAFFPKHDLDEPLIEPALGGVSPIAEVPARPPSSRHRQRKSIRLVAAERKRKLDGVSEVTEHALPSTRPSHNRRATKLWGSKLEEVNSSRRSSEDNASPLSGSKPVFKWILGELIGKGTYGRVYLALNATTGEVIAVKQVEKPQTVSDKADTRQKEYVDSLQMESDTLRELDHPNIVQYLGFEDTPENFSIFLEYVSGGSIRSCLRAHGRFHEHVVKSFTSQILSGLEYLHSKGFIHRDVKADNILVEMSGTCKISDFGTSKKTAGQDDSPATALRGTTFWMAPEMVHVENQRYSVKVDIWSVGCLVLEMWSGHRPWADEHHVIVLMKLGRKDSNSCPPIPPGVILTPLADNFRMQCFQIDPDKRPSAAELRTHPYLELPSNWMFTGFTEEPSSSVDD